MYAARTFLDMKRLVRVMAPALVLLVMVSGHSGNASARTYASIVVDADTGRVIHETNADARIYPASLTKMMSLYLLFESIEKKKVRLSDSMKASQRAVRQPPSKLGLRVGQSIAVESAIKALVVKSANDVAVVVAEHLGRTESGFAAMMTKKAKALGMTGTVFRNASGLPHRGQFSTARDLMKLSVALKRDFPSYYKYFSVQSFDYAGATLETHNRVLKNYDGADGLKTGYINASGFNVATSARRGHISLVGVVIGGRTAMARDRHMMDLLDKSFLSAGVMVPHAYQRAQADGKHADEYRVSAQSQTVPASYKKGQAGENRQNKRKDIASQRAAGETWGIQVGAFKGMESADKEAKRAASALKRGSGGIPLVVPASSAGSKNPLYRARLIGFDTERHARNACNALKKKAFRCAVVSPGPVEVAMTP